MLSINFVSARGNEIVYSPQWLSNVRTQRCSKDKNFYRTEILTFLIILLMITVKGYLIHKILPKGYITKKSWEPLLYNNQTNFYDFPGVTVNKLLSKINSSTRALVKYRERRWLLHSASPLRTGAEQTRKILRLVRTPQWGKYKSTSDVGFTRDGLFKIWRRAEHFTTEIMNKLSNFIDKKTYLSWWFRTQAPF